jgi:SWI/SNF-related matrix-associated actin-dependent regulator of chromatin subfamily A3
VSIPRGIIVLAVDANLNIKCKRHTGQALQVIKYHGQGREQDIVRLKQADVVLTTYNTLAAEKEPKAKKSLLHKIGWYRLILDEGNTCISPFFGDYGLWCVHAEEFRK